MSPDEVCLIDPYAGSLVDLIVPNEGRDDLLRCAGTLPSRGLPLQPEAGAVRLHSASAVQAGGPP